MERRPVSLDEAAEHLTTAVRSLATSESPLGERLQTAWDEHVQLVWKKPCLTREAVAAAQRSGDEPLATLADLR
jgi:hypothetical protein